VQIKNRGRNGTIGQSKVVEVIDDQRLKRRKAFKESGRKCSIQSHVTNCQMSKLSVARNTIRDSACEFNSLHNQVIKGIPVAGVGKRSGKHIVANV